MNYESHRTILQVAGFAFMAACLVAFASPVLADWQYTRWGMSVDEVRDVFPVPVTEHRDAAETDFGFPLLSTPYEVGALSGNVIFLFRDQALATVVFMFVGKDQDLALMMLGDRFGEPVSRPDEQDLIEQVWHWRDEVSGNNIRYVHYPTSFDPDLIIYSPLGETGL